MSGEQEIAGAKRCDCDEAIAELWAYLDAELTAEEADRVREHLTECRGCHEEYDVEIVVKRLVRRCYEESDVAPADLRTKIHERLTTISLRATGPID